MAERWLSIGWVDPVLLVVVHAVRGVHGEIIRIISARKANAYERAIYHEAQN
ncbi:BrnT family toxin [Rhodanobacter caeni]|uniref:BrnT family toxin n=1 Tax=Rhodanobacter caeni TaxID=657654 RepID=A0ABN0UA85_9GAMM